jgi:hypothetical protein
MKYGRKTGRMERKQETVNKVGVREANYRKRKNK